MMTNWKRKLTSRKFWAAVAGFITGIIIYITSEDKSPEKLTAVIMSAGSLIGYIIGEGIADGGNGGQIKGTVINLPLDELEQDETTCGADGCTITYHDEEVM